MKKIFFFLVLTMISQVGITYRIQAQSDNFDITAYKQFLSNHQNLSADQVLQMYPADSFAAKVYQAQPALYLDSIILKYNLTNHEQSLINQHGFMVSERLSRNTFGEALLDIWHKDLPVFISTDAILHTLHMSFDNILIDVERQILIPKLVDLLTKLHNQVPVLATTYAADTAITQSLKDVDVYLTIPRKLLGQVASPYYSDNNAVITQLLNLIQAEQPANYPLFASVNRTLDFSQFKVRGHYTNENYPELGKYFKAMMWLGRTEIYLLAPKSLDQQPTKEDIQRQTIDAVLILEAAQLSNSFPILEEIDSIIKFFVGESDNVTLPNIQQLVTAANINYANQLLDNATLQKFQDTLKTKSYAFQRILSQILYNDPMNPDSIVPASAFLLLGQRFIIDSYVTGQVVFDRINYNGFRIPRMLPSTLDVLFALGNNATAQLLQSELDQYHYGTNLAALRYLVDSYGSDFWSVSLFNLWLNSLRSLNPPTNRDNLPPFMQTAAWWQEKMNTQLASWAQLRHDVLLYAKQSYTGGIICSYPYSYVEPFPAFYNALKTFAQIAKDKFSLINFTDGYTKTRILNYFTHMEGIVDTLGTIAQKELDNTPLSNSEKQFLKQMLFTESICGVQYNGWYYKLYYTGDEGFVKKDLIVADIHTAPTDASGYPIGWVLHAGTGYINLGVFVAELSGVGQVAFVGPVISYHEYLSTNFLRLSDEEWKASYLFQSTRPSFVNLYLADSTGNSRGSGLNLFTSVSDKPNNIPKSFVLHQNFPNPFNSTTVISFNIPEDLAYSNVELNIYNIHGQLVKKLLKESLPARTYFTRWDGTDDSNKPVSSGVYFYRIVVSSSKVGSNILTGKMILTK
ncbi:MAG: DUF3160 domain-containing protein [Bacteroidota bacterium]|nr:DUF3160 domain-containing protein [Bacteroidota bacterium]